MSISLIGIISVQVFWIKKSIDLAENQFTSDVKSALMQVSQNISDRELNQFYNKYSRFAQNRENLTESEIKDFIYQQVDTARQETFTYAQSILEENYRVPTEFFENDSLNFTKILSKEEVTIIKNQISGDEDIENMAPEERFFKYEELKDVEKLLSANQSRILFGRMPIHQRVSNDEITFGLEKELTERGIDTEFKYGVYNNDFATKLKSGYFRKNADKTYVVNLFADNDGESNYQLHVSFPDKKNFLLASVGKILALSVLFILVIILAFVSSLYQMIKQKQISEIKTDFINNMTHEFKTPIATINLALDAIKNPKIIKEEEKILRYVQMIRDENKRMHAQVENVLRISKLEKNQLDLSKEKEDLNDLIEEAISHVELMVQSKGGYINTHLNAVMSEILANNFHLTNVIVNMLDNAIKYSPNAPKIDIFTENTARNIILKVKDEGMGMTKNVQKNIFKKFYREETGNIHNVKGHGLGLAYVKKIIEDHQGTVHVESERGKGSTFIVKLPLI
ncbi:sensor histidine kinase [Urechidicola croceus]|nr:HAMP domain-containing sensor histidine kinase [Urechidicola croceus]